MPGRTNLPFSTSFPSFSSSSDSSGNHHPNAHQRSVSSWTSSRRGSGEKRDKQRAGSDPFSSAFAPPEDETSDERSLRLDKEAEARRISDAIDEQLKAERQQHKRGRIVKVLLLGQSESGAWRLFSLRHKFNLINESKLKASQLLLDVRISLRVSHCQNSSVLSLVLIIPAINQFPRTRLCMMRIFKPRQSSSDCTRPPRFARSAASGAPSSSSTSSAPCASSLTPSPRTSPRAPARNLYTPSQSLNPIGSATVQTKRRNAIGNGRIHSKDQECRAACYLR